VLVRERQVNAPVRLWSQAAGVIVWFDDVSLVRQQ